MEEVTLRDKIDGREDDYAGRLQKFTLVVEPGTEVAVAEIRAIGKSRPAAASRAQHVLHKTRYKPDVIISTPVPQAILASTLKVGDITSSLTKRVTTTLM